MANPGLLCGGEHVKVGTVVDRPGVAGGAGARSQARDHGIEAFAGKPVGPLVLQLHELMPMNTLRTVVSIELPRDKAKS